MRSRKPTAMDQRVGQRIRLARKVAKLSQSKLGDSVGVTYQQIQKYENGTDRIGAGRLYHVAQVTDQPISFFFNEAEDYSYEALEVNDLLADPKIQRLITIVSKVENRKLLINLVSIADTFATADPEPETDQ